MNPTNIERNAERLEPLSKRALYAAESEGSVVEMVKVGWVLHRSLILYQHSDPPFLRIIQNVEALIVLFVIFQHAIL